MLPHAGSCMPDVSVVEKGKKGIDPCTDPIINKGSGRLLSPETVSTLKPFRAVTWVARKSRLYRYRRQVQCQPILYKLNLYVLPKPK